MLQIIPYDYAHARHLVKALKNIEVIKSYSPCMYIYILMGAYGDWLVGYIIIFITFLLSTYYYL